MKKIKIWVIASFGLRGSWKWAKREMMNGAIIKSRRWSGSLTLRIDSHTNGLLLCTWDYLDRDPKWEPARWFIHDDETVDYFVTARIGISYPNSLKWEVVL